MCWLYPFLEIDWFFLLWHFLTLYFCNICDCIYASCLLLWCLLAALFCDKWRLYSAVDWLDSSLLCSCCTNLWHVFTIFCHDVCWLQLLWWLFLSLTFDDYILVVAYVGWITLVQVLSVFLYDVCGVYFSLTWADFILPLHVLSVFLCIMLWLHAFYMCYLLSFKTVVSSNLLLHVLAVLCCEMCWLYYFKMCSDCILLRQVLTVFFCDSFCLYVWLLFSG